MKESTYTAVDKAELDKIFEMRVVDYIILGIYSIVVIIVVAGTILTVTMVFFAVIYSAYTYFYYLFLWLL